MNSPKPKIVIVHHHIFKNAGTSFNYALRQSFGTQFSEYDLPNSAAVNAENLAQHLENNDISAVSGHHICFPTPQRDSIKTISSVIIRSPLDRVRSIYSFERKQDAQTEGAIMAKQLVFKDFVAWRLKTAPHVFCDYQTLYCSRTGNLPAGYVPSQADLDLAIANLKTCFAVGTVKRYKEFLMLAQYEASQYFPDIILRNSHLNVTSISSPAAPTASPKATLTEELGEDLVAQLQDRNQLDTQLYEFTNELLDSWLQTDTEKKVKYFNASGESLIENREWRTAKAMLRNAVSFNFGWFKPYHNLARALEKLGDVDEAIAYYRQALAMNPGFAWSYFRLGDIFYKQEAFTEALSHYKTAISVHPIEKSFFLYISLGNTLAKLNKADEAVEAYLKADEIDPYALISKAKLAWIYTVSNQANQSNQYIERLLQTAPDQCTAYIELGNVFLAHHNPHMAVKFYKKGTKSNPHNKICAEKLHRAMNDLVSV